MWVAVQILSISRLASKDCAEKRGSRCLMVVGPLRCRTWSLPYGWAERKQSPRQRSTDRSTLRADLAVVQQVATPERVVRPPKSRRTRRVSMWTVDRWPLANIHTRHLGASRGRYPSPGVIDRGHPPPWRPISQYAKASRPQRLCGGRKPGELSGGKRMATGFTLLRMRWSVPSRGRATFGCPFH